MPRLEASVDTRLEASTSLDQAASCRTSYGAIVTCRASLATVFLPLCSKRSLIMTAPYPPLAFVPRGGLLRVGQFRVEASADRSPGTPGRSLSLSVRRSSPQA